MRPIAIQIEDLHHRLESDGSRFVAIACTANGLLGEGPFETEAVLNLVAAIGLECRPTYLATLLKSGELTRPSSKDSVGENPRIGLWDCSEIAQLLRILLARRKFLPGAHMSEKTNVEAAKDEVAAAKTIGVIEFLATHTISELEHRLDVASDPGLCDLIRLAIQLRYAQAGQVAVSN